MRGRFIVVEGLGGSGKSTVVENLRGRLAPHKVYFTYEPGGTPLADEIRKALKSHNMTSQEQLLLLEAIRYNHRTKVIQPRLRRGENIICDRFSGSTAGYQLCAGDGGEPSRQLFHELEAWSVGECKPDLWIFIDVPIDVCLRRIATAKRKDPDVFDEEGSEFQWKVREGILGYLTGRPHVIVEGNRDREEVLTSVIGHILACLPH
jgi:dTMP kinase